MKYTLEPDKLISRLYMGNEMYDEYIELRNNVNSDIMTIANDFETKRSTENWQISTPNGEITSMPCTAPDWSNMLRSSTVPNSACTILTNPHCTIKRIKIPPLLLQCRKRSGVFML